MITILESENLGIILVIFEVWKGLVDMRCEGKKILRNLLIALFCVILVPLAAPVAFAASSETHGQDGSSDIAAGSGMAEIASQVNKEDDSFAPEKGYKIKSKSGNSTFYDLRHVMENGVEKNYVTPVKEQSPYGSCWSFGAIAASETNILSSGLAGGYDEKTLNLSEKQAAWFNACRLNESGNPQNGEGMVFGEGATDVDKYNIGGVTVFVTSLFAQGVGPVHEDTDTEDGKIFRYQGKAGEVTSDIRTWIDKETGEEKSGWKNVFYSDQDDWSIPEKYRFMSDYSLRESYILPSPSEISDSDLDGKTTAIKNQLHQKRGVAIEICADSYMPEQHQEQDEYMSENWAQYTYEELPTNHVVCIVGYDDNYPKENFVKGHLPPGDGAWLVKNSWGSDLEEFPNNSYRHFGLVEGYDRAPYNADAETTTNHTGYFWLSYYDKTLAAPEAYSFEEKDPDQIVAQHDFMPVEEYEEYATEAENATANVFTAKSTSQLTDISFFTATPGTKVSYEVYLLKDDPKGPADGVLAASSSAPITCEYGGYHKVALDASAKVLLSKGQKYSVVVKQQTPSGKYSVSFNESGSEMWVRHNRWFTSVVNKGESYFYIDGKWNDLSNKELRKIITADKEAKCIDNFSIKAYSKNISNSGTYLSVVPYPEQDTKDIDLKQGEGEDVTLKLTIRGAQSDMETQPVITWTPTNPELFDVTPGATEAQVTLRGKKPGSGYLIIDAGTYGKKIIGVTVHKFRLEKVTMPKGFDVTVYNGKAYKPEPIDVVAETITNDSKHGLVKGKEYTLKYQDNVKCGRGFIFVTGIGKYEGTIKNNMYDKLSFVIYPAKAKISKLTPGKNQLKVDFVSQKASGITGYVLSYKEVGTKTVKTKKLGASATSALLTGLKTGKKYEVSLKAYVTAMDEEAAQFFDDDRFNDTKEDYYGAQSAKVISDVITNKKPNGSSGGNESKSSTVKSVPLTNVTKAIKGIKKDGDLKGSTFGTLRLTNGKVKKKSIRLKWKKKPGSKGYVIYGNRCGAKYKFKKLATVPAAKNTWNCKKLKKGKYYKFIVVAYKTEQGVEKVTAASKTIHVATKGKKGKARNYKSVKLKRKTAMMKQGAKLKLKAKAVPLSKKKKVKKHRKIAFESSNKNIATVNAKGLITAKKKGTCRIFAYTQNGKYKSVKVTVK